MRKLVQLWSIIFKELLPKMWRDGKKAEVEMLVYVRRELTER